MSLNTKCKTVNSENNFLKNFHIVCIWICNGAWYVNGHWFAFAQALVILEEGWLCKCCFHTTVECVQYYAQSSNF